MINFNPTAPFAGNTPNNRFDCANASGWWGFNGANTYMYVANSNAFGRKIVYERGTSYISSTLSNHGGQLNGPLYSTGAWITNAAPTIGSWTTNATMLARGGYYGGGIYGGTGADYYVSASGAAEAVSNLPGTPNFSGTSDFGMGGVSGAGSSYWSGEIAELIAFNGKQTGLDSLKAQSYLALKYGITLDQTIAQDYVLSDGTTIAWPGNTAYPANIAGIGRDDNSGLYQRESKSVNSGNQLVVSLNTIAANNASNSGSFVNNKQFLIWGDDGANDAGTLVTGLAGVNYRFNKWFKMVNTGGVNQTVTIYYPARAFVGTVTNYYLIVNSSASTAGATTAVMNITPVSIGSINYYSITYNFSNPVTYFTFGKLAVLPGGVGTGLQLWERADMEVTATAGNVTQWANVAPEVTMATQPFKTATNHVTFLNSAINYNPVVNFDGTASEVLTGYQSAVPPAPNVKSFIFAVALPTVLSNGCCQDVFSTGIAGSIGLAYNITSPTASMWAADASGGYGGLQPATLNQPALVRVNYADDASTLGSTTALNGLLSPAASWATPVFSSIQSTGFQIGGRTYGGWPARVFPGYIAEVIHYNGNNITSTEESRIQSYLALKYGISLDPTAATYKNSAATDIYSIDAVFKNDIIGIIKDSISGLLQKQSRTQDDSLRVFAGSLAATNAANTSTITYDKSSIVIGHNKGILKNDPSASKPVTIYSRLGRVWKVTNTNFADNFGIEIKWDSVGTFRIGDLRLLVSDDPNDFTSAQVYSSYDVNFYIGSIIVTNINSSVIIPVNSTKYITIGSVDVLTPLAAPLQQFTASVTAAQQVKLNWTSSKEVNSNYFAVERSANGRDWQTVTTVKAAGNSTLAKNYTAIDQKPLSGISYYRLKQIDMDGKYSYSEIRSVTIEAGSNNSLLVYPNPASNRLTVKASAAELETLQVFSSMGQDLTSLVKPISNSNTVRVLDISRLPAGIYSIKTSNNATKILKQ